MQPIPITLLTAAVIIIAVSTIACTPASPGRQSNESENATTTPEPTATLKPGEPTRKLKPGDPVPTLAGTPPAIYLHNPEGTLTPHEFRDPPLTPPVLPSHLKGKIERREATQEARRSTGQSEGTDEKLWVEINLDSDDRVDKVAKYLEKKSIPIVGTGTSASFVQPWIIAIVPISMVREFSELEGVVRIRELEKSAPG